MDLSGRHVLVTGASRGIGAGLVRAFARAGARPSGIARSAGQLEDVLGSVGGQAFPADLTDLEALPGLVDRVEAEAGPIDVLVNNAGVSHVGHALDRTPRQIGTVLDLNLHAPVRLCQRLIPGMRERGGGHVVNMSSMAAVMPTPGLVHYGASKAGLDQYTAGLRQDLRGLPVGLTLVHLGSVDTGLDDLSREYGPIAERSADHDDRLSVTEVAEEIVRAVHRGRRHVRMPRYLAPLAALAEGPRRVGEWIFGSVDTRPDAAGDAGGAGR